MKELSLHILDIVQNSTKAGASEVFIDIVEDIPGNRLEICIRDNGRGIKKDLLATITDPFSTSRTTRRVGLGLSLLKFAAELCNGSMLIESEEGKGTTVIARFEHQHIDRMPLGDMASTIISSIIGNPDVDFRYVHQVNEQTFEFHTFDIKQELGELPITDVSVISFLSEYVQNNIHELYNLAMNNEQ